MDSLEEQLFEAQAARDEARARCTRLESRLQELFGAALLSEQQREALRQSSSKRNTGGSAGGAAAARARENDLIATIESLQKALEKKQRDAEHTVPSSRHMQVRMSAIF